MTPLQAIEAATARGPETLGPQAPNAGQMIEGMDADVICVSGDPTADVSILGNPDNVTQVFKGGVRYKGCATRQSDVCSPTGPIRAGWRVGACAAPTKHVFRRF